MKNNNSGLIKISVKEKLAFFAVLTYLVLCSIELNYSHAEFNPVLRDRIVFKNCAMRIDAIPIEIDDNGSRIIQFELFRLCADVIPERPWLFMFYQVIDRHGNDIYDGKVFIGITDEFMYMNKSDWCNKMYVPTAGKRICLQLNGISIGPIQLSRLDCMIKENTRPIE